MQKGHLKANPKGGGNGRAPKEDYIKKKAVLFVNFPEMQKERHITFLYELIDTYKLQRYFEWEPSNDGVMKPVLYPFGRDFAKSFTLLCKSEGEAAEFIKDPSGSIIQKKYQATSA